MKIAGLAATIAVIASLFSVLVVAPAMNRDERNLGGQQFNVLANIATTGTMAFSTNQQLVATNTARAYLAIVNNSTQGVYLSLNKDKAAVVGRGIYLAANGGSFEILPDNLYLGAVTAIAENGTASTSILEMTN